jgi:hypothetical protein
MQAENVVPATSPKTPQRSGHILVMLIVFIIAIELAWIVALGIGISLVF